MKKAELEELVEEQATKIKELEGMEQEHLAAVEAMEELHAKVAGLQEELDDALDLYEHDLVWRWWRIHRDGPVLHPANQPEFATREKAHDWFQQARLAPGRYLLMAQADTGEDEATK